KSTNILCCAAEPCARHKTGILKEFCFFLCVFECTFGCNCTHFLFLLQISDICMIPIKETRARIYQMMRDNYLVLEEVPKHNDQSGRSLIYLWSTQMIAVRRH